MMCFTTLVFACALWLLDAHEIGGRRCKEKPKAFGCPGVLKSTSNGSSTEQVEPATVPSGPETKVIGGSITRDCRWPSVVRIERNCVLTCTGSLMSPGWVLTAARCVDDGLPSEYVFTVGEPAKDYSISREQRATAAKIVLHPKYERTNEKVRKNDIALVQMRPGFFTTDCVRMASLPAAGYFEIGPSYFVGWGSSNSASPSADFYALNSVELEVICEKKCRRLLGGGIDDKLESNMFCIYEPDGRGPFAQDAGGPLFFYSPNESYPKVAMQVGLFSWNLYEGTVYPSVFMRVSAYTSWIQQTIK